MILRTNFQLLYSLYAPFRCHIFVQVPHQAENAAVQQGLELATDEEREQSMQNMVAATPVTETVQRCSPGTRCHQLECYSPHRILPPTQTARLLAVVGLQQGYGANFITAWANHAGVDWHSTTSDSVQPSASWAAAAGINSDLAG